MATSGLIQEFNNLGGLTCKEHTKNFFLYMNKLTALSEHERLNVLNNLKADHRQEEIFLAKLLLKYEQTEKLKQILLQGDRILNRIIANYKPFVLRNESIEYFITDLFPNVSYIIRNRCLNNLARIIDRDDVGEDTFRRILDRYGIKTAQNLLPVCSEAFIREVLTQYRVIFRERQLVRLHQRFGQDFLHFYYAECAKYSLSNQFAEQPFFAKYIATTDIRTFCQLLKYGPPKIGRRGFIQFIQHKKAEFLKEPSKYAAFVKRRILYRLLTPDEFRTYVLNQFPKSFSDFTGYNICEDVKLLNLKVRGSFLSSIFQEKYGIQMYTKYSNKKDSPQPIDCYIRGILSTEDILKFPMDEDDLLEYLPPAEAFPQIKERINLTSDMNTRCELILKLFRCAKNNNDEDALLQALKYFNHRHKNDVSSIREDVYNFLRTDYKMEKLGAEVWEGLHEMFLAEQMLCKYDYNVSGMMAEECHYKFLNGLDFTNEFRKFIKYQGRHYLGVPSANKDLQRWALLHLPEVCTELFKDDEAKTWPRQFLSALQRWNKEHPKDIISYYDYPEVLKRALEHDDPSPYYYEEVIPKYVLPYDTKSPEDRKLQDELLEQYISKYASNERLWRWLLHNRVGMVDKHYELFFEKCTNTYAALSFMYDMNKMHYTSLPAKFRSKSLEYLKEHLDALDRNDDDESARSSKCKMALLCLSFHADFLRIVDHDRINPEEEAKVDVLDECFRFTLEIREQVLECLRNRPVSEEVMRLLMRFCYKDYFSAALPVLNAVLYNLPERLLAPALDILRERSVSVRKRALFFATTLNTAQKSCEALKYAGEHEKNKSLLKFLVNRTFKNFRFVGDAASWQLLMDHFKFVFEKDTETQCLLLQFGLIPRSYLPTYVEKVWYSIGKRWGSLHMSVLSAINTDLMPLLSDALCDDIIHHNLSNCKDLVSSDVDFIYEYLLSSGEKIDHRFDLVSNNARVVADENAQLDFKEFNRKSQNICFLYKDICRRFMCSEDGDTPTRRAEKIMLADKLGRSFPNLPLPYNHLDYQLQIDICKCFLSDAARIPELIIRMQKEVLEKHGDMMLQYFNDFIASQHLYSSDVDTQIEFVQKLLELDNSTNVKLLALNLMPTGYPDGEKHALHFRHLIEKIEADSAPIVSLFLNRYLKNLSV